MNKSTFDPNLRNFLTLSNNAKISYVSSQKRGCSIENILNEEPKSIWLSEDGLPQEIIIDLTSLTITPSQINCIGIYCWHAYQTNPKLIEISISQNGSKFSSLGNFDLVLKPGTQLFDIDTLSIDEVQYLKLTIKETFNGDRTYLNNVLMYEKMPSNDEINNHNSLNESSFMMYVRESRERNMPFCMKETNVSSSGNNLKTMLNKVNSSNSGGRALNVNMNMNLISKDLADDLLDMKSKDKFSIMNSVGNVGGGILNTNENNIIMYDDVLERNYNSNSNKKINNNNINISHNERILIGNSGIIEEEDDKERSSNYNTSAKKKNVNTVIIREKEAIRYDDNDNEVDDDNQNINNESIHDNEDVNNNNNTIQKTLFRPNDNIIIPSTYFKNIPTNTHKQQQLPIDNVDPLSKYIKSEESQDDSSLKKQNVIITNVSQLENEFRTYQNIQDDKYKQLSNRMGRLEKNISGLKDEISKLNNNLNILMEAQNNQCNFILEECKTMINNKLLTIIGNINQMQQQQPHHPMINNNIPHNMMINNNNNINNDYNHQQLSESTKFKEEIDEHDLLDTRHRDNTSMNEMGLSGKESELEKMNEIFESKFEEKLANFSNQLGKKISDTLLKPSFEKLENLMKGNLNEVKNSLKMVEKKAKGSYRNTNYYNSNRNNNNMNSNSNNAYGSSSHNYKGKSLREKDDNSITGINEEKMYRNDDDGYNYSGSKHGKYKKKQK